MGDLKRSAMIWGLGIGLACGYIAGWAFAYPWNRVLWSAARAALGLAFGLVFDDRRVRDLARAELRSVTARSIHYLAIEARKFTPKLVAAAVFWLCLSLGCGKYVAKRCDAHYHGRRVREALPSTRCRADEFCLRSWGSRFYSSSATSTTGECNSGDRFLRKPIVLDGRDAAARAGGDPAPP